VTVAIRPLDPAADAPACDTVLASLPYFFGDPDGIASCAAAVRSETGWVADDGGDIAGFVTMATHFAGSHEITWLAVHSDRRRAGIGQSLVDAAVGAMRDAGDQCAFVLTLGPSVPEPGITDGYEGTRRFWTAQRFLPLREFALRDWNDDAALLLCRWLG
jgi:GNAT superfamily N-acetyltransferase